LVINVKLGVNLLPKEIYETIARLQLEVLGIKIDEPTAEQKKYQEIDMRT